MFLHPLCCGLTSHKTVVCGSHKKHHAPQISSDSASYLVSDKWVYFFLLFLKEGGVTGSVAEISCCAEDTNEAWFSTLVKLS